MLPQLISDGGSRGTTRNRWRARSAIAIGAALAAGIAMLGRSPPARSSPASVRWMPADTVPALVRGCERAATRSLPGRAAPTAWRAWSTPRCRRPWATCRTSRSGSRRRLQMTSAHRWRCVAGARAGGRLDQRGPPGRTEHVLRPGAHPRHRSGRRRESTRSRTRTESDTFTAEAGDRNINFTEDIGCAAAPCGFAQALQGRIGPFLTWNPAQAPAPPAGFIGNPGVEHTVVGSPFGTNFFRITGPGLGAGGVQTNQFTVQGKLATGAQSTPDLVTASDTGRSASDNVTRSTSPTFAGFIDPDQAGETVQVLVDGAVAGSAAASGTAYQVRTAGLAPGGTSCVPASPEVASPPTRWCSPSTRPATRDPAERQTQPVQPEPGQAHQSGLPRPARHPTSRLPFLRSGRVVKSFGSRSLDPSCRERACYLERHEQGQPGGGARVATPSGRSPLTLRATGPWRGRRSRSSGNAARSVS